MEPGANGGYALVIRNPQGVISQPAVATRTVPFDVDLGARPGGKILAAYSRCATDPRVNRGTALPIWTSGRRCRIELLDLATGKVTRRARDTRFSSQVLPTVGGNRLAYVGVPSSGSRASLASVDLRSGRVRALNDVARRGGGDPFGPTATDTDGVRVALVTTSLSEGSYDSDVSLTPAAGGRTVDAGGASQSESCFRQVQGVSVIGTRAVYAVSEGDGFYTVLARRRSSLAYGPFDAAPTGPVVSSSATKSGRLVVVERTAGGAQVRELALGTASRAAPALVGSSCS